MKTILVAGGGGFVGFHLCKRLLDMGHHVVCLDNFSTGISGNISLLIENKRFKWIEHDITLPYRYGTFNEIFNLACPASPIHYQSDPIQTLKTSVIGTLNLLELARHCSCKYLQASTSEVYGEPRIHPQSESYRGNVNPLGIRACYDEGKRCAETLCMDFFRTYHIPIKIVRIFNTYGPNMRIDDGRVISNFIVQALQNKDITVYGKGNQTRSFQYIDDLIDGLIKMMDSKDSFIGPVNIGNPVEFSIQELAKKIIKLTNSSSKIIYNQLPPDDPTKRKPDITLARSALNWSPQIDLEHGLKSTIEYFKLLQTNGLL